MDRFQYSRGKEQGMYFSQTNPIFGFYIKVTNLIISYLRSGLCLAKTQKKSIGQTNARLFIRLTVFYLRACTRLILFLVEEIIYIIVSAAYALYLENRLAYLAVKEDEKPI